MLTKKAAFGTSLLLASSLTGRVMAMAAQFVAGLVLDPRDFGIYASAVGLVAIAGLLRGGNAQSYLVTLPPTNRRLRTGTVYWVSTALYLVGLLPLVIAAPWIAAWMEQPSLTPLIWVVALTTLGAPTRFVLRARLNTRLRFGANAIATFLNDGLTYLLTIVLAITLRSPMALALPVLLGSLVEVAYLARVAEPVKADFQPRRRFVGPILHQMRWLIAVAAMTSLWTSGDYFVAEFLVPVSVLGTYYFGYQLAVQPGRLFNNTVMNVLVPVVRRVRHDPERLRNAIRRLLGTGGFAIAIVNIGLVAGIEPIERLIWNGRWMSANLAVQCLSIGLVYTSMFGIASSPLLAERRYRDALVCNLLRAGGVVGGAAIGSLLGGTVASIAIWVAASMTVTSLAGIGWILRMYEVAITPVLVHLMRCTAPLAVAGLVAAVVGHEVMSGIGDGRLAAIPAGAAALAVYALGIVLVLPLLPGSTRTEVMSLAGAMLKSSLQRLRSRRASS